MAASKATIVTSLLLANASYYYSGILLWMFLGSSGAPLFYITTSGVWADRVRSPFPIS